MLVGVVGKVPTGVENCSFSLSTLEFSPCSSFSEKTDEPDLLSLLATDSTKDPDGASISFGAGVNLREKRFLFNFKESWSSTFEMSAVLFSNFFLLTWAFP